MARRLWQLGIALLLCAARAEAGDAPAWMHSLTNVSLPTYDEKTDAVLLYSETNLSVVSAGKIRWQVREAYKILRPEGRHHGIVVAYFDSNRRVTSLHGWCIPKDGRDYEVKDKDSVEVSVPNVEGSELITDLRAKVLRIPAPDPGNIVGYEYEVEERPLVLQEVWYLQATDPVRESHYNVQVPSGWEYKASWINHSEEKPETGNNQWRWTVTDLKEIREEEDMPPYRGVAGQMVLSLLPPGGVTAINGYSDWAGMGDWYRNLVSGRLEASAPLKQQVAALTTGKATLLDKMKAIASFVQQDVRYVAIELGIGGFQPHPASDVFSHRYGDCKDKATLTISALHEIGVDAYYVIINHERGVVSADTPANDGFDHAITAIKLPPGVADPSLVATTTDPVLGRILFFDPTDEMTPFGEIRGALQSNYGLLVAPAGGELVKLPEAPPETDGIERTAKFTLDPAGALKGEVEEVRLGDRGAEQRWRLRTVQHDSDRIKPIERLLAASLSNFKITHASAVNMHETDRPFGFNYGFETENYAKSAGNLLLVRPRVLGNKARDILETKEPRKFPIEFEGPSRDIDSFEIVIPAGYAVDDLPPPVDADYSFGSYHSKTEAKDNVIRYTRTLEIKQLSVPVAQAAELKKFYRIIASDERNSAALKLAEK